MATSATYGLPYQGSKSKIAEWVISQLPAADYFVDLFAGGCAVTHAAMLSGKYKHFIANDITDAPQLFLDAISGKYADESRWISREDFHALKETDPYVRLCWSFGNSQDSYLYSEEIEDYKRAFHYAAVFRDLHPFSGMGIDIPGDLLEADTAYQRKLDIGAWLKTNKEEVKARYIAYWVEKCNKQKADYERILERVIDDDLDTAVDEESERLRALLLDALKASGLSQADVNRRLGTQMSSHYFGKSQWAFPTFDEYEKMRTFMPLPENYFEVTNYYTIIKRLQSLQSLERLQSLESLQSLQSLERLERLESLQRLERLQSLEVMCGDYRLVKIPEGASVVIYCDPPYRNTAGYTVDFDFDAFDEWCRAHPDNLYISEYSMPGDFVRKAAKFKRSLMAKGGAGKLKIEGIWTHRAAEAHQMILFDYAV